MADTAGPQFDQSNWNGRSSLFAADADADAWKRRAMFETSAERAGVAALVKRGCDSLALSIHI